MRREREFEAGRWRELDAYGVLSSRRGAFEALNSRGAGFEVGVGEEAVALGSRSHPVLP